MGVEVFDACALIAFIRGELGGSIVDALLHDPNSSCCVHAINLCEVYYQMIRFVGEARARTIIDDLLVLGLNVHDDMDRDFWQSVGERKAGGGIALPDCFCLTLAIRLKGQVVTSDHKEFDPLVPLNLCPILFIR